MKDLFQDRKNVNICQGNALDLRDSSDGTYDLVLELGPIYHLKNVHERVVAIKEAVRVAKKGAPIFVSFVLQDAPLIEYIFQSENPAEEINEIGYERDTALVTDNTGSSIQLHTISAIDELTDKVLETLPVSKGPRFAQDGLSQVRVEFYSIGNRENIKRVNIFGLFVQTACRCLNHFLKFTCINI